MGPLMRGPTTVRLAIESFLELTMPAVLVAAREEWDLPEWMRPDPAEYNSYDPLSGDDTPSYAAFSERTSGWSRVDLSDGEQHYRANYRVILSVTVATPQNPTTRRFMAPARDHAIMHRDDLMALTRMVILDRPSLMSDGMALVNESTLSEGFSDAFQVSDKSAMWLASGTIAFDMQMTEQTRHVPLGTSEVIDVEESSQREPME